jgi:hypothetical protein
LNGGELSVGGAPLLAEFFPDLGAATPIIDVVEV